MRISTLIFCVLLPATALPAYAQQTSPQAVQDEADKGVKTRNSGASGVVGEQKPGSAQMPGQMGTDTPSVQPSAQNSGTGVSGAAGNKNGPPAHSATTGSSNSAVQQQDSSGVKGLPGNKSGPPAKR
jgi:hypothetical protein